MGNLSSVMPHPPWCQVTKAHQAAFFRVVWRVRGRTIVSRIGHALTTCCCNLTAAQLLHRPRRLFLLSARAPHIIMQRRGHVRRYAKNDPLRYFLLRRCPAPYRRAAAVLAAFWSFDSPSSSGPAADQCFHPCVAPPLLRRLFNAILHADGKSQGVLN